MRRSARRETGTSLDSQRQSLLAWAHELDLDVDSRHDIYIDDGFSASRRTRRPGLVSLLERVAAGEYDIVLIAEFSRWTRNRAENAVVADILRESGCRLRSLREPWLVLDGELSFLLQWLADMCAAEAERMSARISAWHEVRLEADAHHGQVPWGLRAVDVPSPYPDRLKPLQIVEPDEECRAELGGRSRADLIRLMFDWAADGATPAAVVRRLGTELDSAARGHVPARPASVATLLRNPRFAGFLTHRGEIVVRDGRRVQPYAPTVSPDVFDTVQSVLAQRALATPARRSLLKGLLRCAGCGGSLVGSGYHPRYGAYFCWSDTCTAKARMKSQMLEDEVLRQVCTALSTPAKARRRLGLPTARRERTHAAKVALLRDALTDCERRWLEGGHADEGQYRAERERHQQTISKTERAWRTAARRPPSGLEAVVAGEQNPRELLGSLERSDLQRLLGELIDHVVVRQVNMLAPTPVAERVVIAWASVG